MQLLEANETVAPGASPSTRKTVVRLAAILIALTLLALYVQRLRLPSAGLDQDDGVYLVTAKALATGQGYKIVSLPTPIAQTKYPILFPALLALVWKVFPEFPENLLMLKLVPFLATLAWLALVYRYYRGEGLVPHRAVVLTSVLAIVPWVLFLGSTLLSETLFFALTIASLLLIRRLERSSVYSRMLPLAAGALAGGATLTRIAGVSLIAAGALALIRKSKTAAALFLAAALAISLPWFAWASRTAASGSDAYYSAKNYSGWNVVFNFTPEQKLDIVLTNLAATIGSFGLLFEYHLATVAILITAAVIAGFVLDIRRTGFSGIHLFCLAYLGLTLLWAWYPLRFLVLLAPFLLLFIFRLTVACAEKTRLRWLPAAALLLILPMLGDDSLQFWQSPKTGAVDAPGVTDQPPAKWYEYAEIASWIRAHAPPGAVVAANVDPVFYLYAGHPSVRGFSADPYLLFYAPSQYSPGNERNALGSVSDFVDGLKRQNVTVLVCTSESGFAERKPLNKLTTAAVSLYPAAFHLALQLPDPAYRVYFVDPARLPLVPDLP